MQTDDEVFTPKQEEAYDTILEEGGEEQWLEAGEVSDPRTLDALQKKGVVQLKENEHGGEFVAMAGVALGGPPEPEIENEPEEPDEVEAESDGDDGEDPETEATDETVDQGTESEGTDQSDEDLEDVEEKLAAIGSMTQSEEAEAADLDALIDDASWPDLQKGGSKLWERVEDEIMEENGGPWGSKKSEIVEFMHRHEGEAKQALLDVREDGDEE